MIQNFHSISYLLFAGISILGSSVVLLFQTMSDLRGYTDLGAVGLLIIGTAWLLRYLFSKVEKYEAKNEEYFKKREDSLEKSNELQLKKLDSDAETRRLLEELLRKIDK